MKGSGLRRAHHWYEPSSQWQVPVTPDNLGHSLHLVSDEASKVARLRWCPPGNQLGSSPAGAPLASARTTVHISQFSYLPMHATQHKWIAQAPPYKTMPGAQYAARSSRACQCMPPSITEQITHNHTKQCQEHSTQLAVLKPANACHSA